MISQPNHICKYDNLFTLWLQLLAFFPAFFSFFVW